MIYKGNRRGTWSPRRADNTKKKARDDAWEEKAELQKTAACDEEKEHTFRNARRRGRTQKEAPLQRGWQQQGVTGIVF